MIKNLACLLIAIYAIGCASLGDRKQYVAFQSEPKNIEIYYQGQKQGITPLIIGIDRARDQHISIKTDNGFSEIPLQSKYRWGRSFWGNFAFLTLAPIGWIVDIITEKAYQFDDYYLVRGGLPAQIKISEQKTYPVAIAPPISPHPQITKDVGLKITSSLQKKLGNRYEVIPYEKTADIFRDEGADFDSAIEEKPELKYFAKTGTQKIYFSDLDFSNGEIVVQGKVQDYFAEEKNINAELRFASEEIPRAKDLTWLGTRAKIFYWLPNSISLDLSSASTEFEVLGRRYEAESSHSDDFLGETLKYVSAVGIRRITQPYDHPGWRYKFLMIPTANFSYNKENFPTFAPIAGQDFLRLHMDAGYGPSFNYGSKNWNVYLNIIPVIAYDKITTSATLGNNASRDEGSIQFITEFGLVNYLNERWHWRIFARNAPVNDQLWEEIIRANSGQNFDVESANIIASGLSIGYIIPNHVFNFWHKKNP